MKVTIRFTKDITLTGLVGAPMSSDEHAVDAEIKVGETYNAILVMAHGDIPTYDFTPLAWQGVSDLEHEMLTVDFESYPDCFEIVE